MQNFVFNVGFDRAMLRMTGSAVKSMPVRVLHTLMFEGGLLILLVPMIAWYLAIPLMAALMMDLAIMLFYLVYTFFFNIAYDRGLPAAGNAGFAPPRKGAGRPARFPRAARPGPGPVGRSTEGGCGPGPGLYSAANWFMVLAWRRKRTVADHFLERVAQIRADLVLVLPGRRAPRRISSRWTVLTQASIFWSPK